MPANVARKIARITTVGAAAITATMFGLSAALKGVVGDNDPCDFEFNFEPDDLDQVA